MSDNQLLDHDITAGRCQCGGTTWSRRDDHGLYWQCEQCGECYRDADGTEVFPTTAAGMEEWEAARHAD